MKITSVLMFCSISAFSKSFAAASTTPGGNNFSKKLSWGPCWMMWQNCKAQQSSLPSLSLSSHDAHFCSNKTIYFFWGSELEQWARSNSFGCNLLIRTQHFVPALRQCFVWWYLIMVMFFVSGKDLEMKCRTWYLFTILKNAQKNSTQTKKAIDDFMLQLAMIIEIVLGCYIDTSANDI